MDVPVGAIINISGKIAEYFGLIEGVDTKVTKLLHQSFISAKMNLEYARSASGQNQIDYIKEAKTKFIEAIAVEENENKVLALAGLAMCQIFLKDESNAKLTIDLISNVELSQGEVNKCKAADVALKIFKLDPMNWFSPIQKVPKDLNTKQRNKLLDQSKSKALILIKSINNS